MERMTKRDEDGRARLTKFGMQMYCSTQATADCLAKLEDRLAAYEDAEEQGFLVTLPRDTRARIDVLEDLLRLSKICLARKTGGGER